MAAEYISKIDNQNYIIIISFRSQVNHRVKAASGSNIDAVVLGPHRVYPGRLSVILLFILIFIFLRFQEHSEISKPNVLNMTAYPVSLLQNQKSKASRLPMTVTLSSWHVNFLIEKRLTYQVMESMID